jgi:hypothetical protein
LNLKWEHVDLSSLPAAFVRRVKEVEFRIAAEKKKQEKARLAAEKKKQEEAERRKSDANSISLYDITSKWSYHALCNWEACSKEVSTSFPKKANESCTSLKHRFSRFSERFTRKDPEYYDQFMAFGRLYDDLQFEMRVQWVHNTQWNQTTVNRYQAVTNSNGVKITDKYAQYKGIYVEGTLGTDFERIRYKKINGKIYRKVVFAGDGARRARLQQNQHVLGDVLQYCR